MNSRKKNSAFFSAFAFLIAGVLLSSSAVAQAINSSSNDKQKVKSSVTSDQPTREMDIVKPAPADEAKPYVTGEDGQKILFLADPNKTVLKKNEKNKKETAAKITSSPEVKLQEEETSKK